MNPKLNGIVVWHQTTQVYLWSAAVHLFIWGISILQTPWSGCGHFDTHVSRDQTQTAVGISVHVLRWHHWPHVPCYTKRVTTIPKNDEDGKIANCIQLSAKSHPFCNTTGYEFYSMSCCTPSFSKKFKTTLLIKQQHLDFLRLYLHPLLHSGQRVSFFALRRFRILRRAPFRKSEAAAPTPRIRGVTSFLSIFPWRFISSHPHITSVHLSLPSICIDISWCSSILWQFTTKNDYWNSQNQSILGRATVSCGVTWLGVSVVLLGCGDPPWSTALPGCMSNAGSLACPSWSAEWTRSSLHIERCT